MFSSVDKRGLRVEPPLAPSHGDRCVLFFGCSYTFGEGVNDTETLPYRTGVLAEGLLRMINFGLHSYGPIRCWLCAQPCAAVGGRGRNGLGANLFSAGSQLLVDFILYQSWNERPSETRRPKECRGSAEGSDGESGSGCLAWVWIRCDVMDLLSLLLPL